MTRPALFCLAMVTLAAVVTAAFLGGLALRAAAGRGELTTMPWSAAR